METALYYPYTTVRTKGVLKNGLLLWDRLECIVPSDGQFSRRRYKSKVYNEAFDLLVHDHKPTREEKTKAHAQVKTFLQEAPPASFLQDAISQGGGYLIYPGKLERHTWRMLERHGLAAYDDPTADYAVPPAVGLLLMSILADQCAGKQKQKITDLTRAYSWVSQYYANRLGGTFVTGLDASDVGTNYERLVAISLKVLARISHQPYDL